MVVVIAQSHVIDVVGKGFPRGRVGFNSSCVRAGFQWLEADRKCRKRLSTNDFIWRNTAMNFSLSDEAAKLNEIIKVLNDLTAAQTRMDAKIVKIGEILGNALLSIDKDLDEKELNAALVSSHNEASGSLMGHHSEPRNSLRKFIVDLENSLRKFECKRK